MIKSKPGAMIQMSPTIVLQGKVKFSMRKMLTGGQMAESTFTGPGEVSLAPTLLGDVTAIPIGGNEGWNLGKDAFLACTGNVVKDTKSQGLGKAFFSGEDLFIYRISGQGTLWVTSFGAIVVREVSPAHAFTFVILLSRRPAEPLCLPYGVVLRPRHSPTLTRSNSSGTMNSISSTMATWWPGAVSTR